MLFLLSAVSVNAEGVVLSKENEDIEIGSSEDSAVFDLVILNDDRRERDFFITFPYNPNLRVNVEPYLLKIPSKSTKKANIQIFSLNNKNLGSYELNLNIKSRDKEINEVYTFKVTILPFSGDEVITQLTIPDRIDPRVGGIIKLKLENLREFDIEDLEVFVKSKDIFSERRFLNLKSGEINLQEFKFELLKLNSKIITSSPLKGRIVTLNV